MWVQPGVDGVRALLLAEADSEHLRRAALDGAAEGCMRFDPVDYNRRVRPVSIPIHEDFYPRGRLAEQY